MRRVLMGGILAAGFVLCVVSASYAWWGKKAKEAPASTKEVARVEASVRAEEAVPAAPAEEIKEEERPAPVPPAVSTEDLAKKRAQKEKKRKAIDGNQWEVTVIPMSGKGEKTLDTLVFSDNKFFSQVYEKKGYAPSNYTVSLTDEGRPVVETMQSEEKMGILFWRVEFDENLAGCRGVISHQVSENKTEDYSFVSTGKKPVVK